MSNMTPRIIALVVSCDSDLAWNVYYSYPSLTSLCCVVVTDKSCSLSFCTVAHCYVMLFYVYKSVSK